ncbi:hypothetical protein LguiB_021911 [Lonicera macranthoides]
MGTMWNVVLGFKATIVMVVVQIMFAGANVLYKLAANDGMIVRIMVAYRSIFAAAFMVLLTLYDEMSATRKNPNYTARSLELAIVVKINYRRRGTR